MNTNFYDYLQEKVKESIEVVELESFNPQKTLILGSNLLEQLEKLINNLKGMHPEMDYVFIGHENQLSYVRRKLGEQYMRILWEGRYSVQMVERLKEDGILEQIDALLFFSASPVNMRDLNLMDIALELEKYKIEAYVYDYGMKEIYRYRNVQIVEKGLRLYQQVNDFLEITM